MQNDIFPILLGATEGAYALSRAFYHDYGIRPLVIDENAPTLFSHTACASVRCVKNFSHPAIFYRCLDDLYEDKKGKNLMLIPLGDPYTELVLEREAYLAKMFLLPHLPHKLSAQAYHPDRPLVFLYRTKNGASLTVCGECAAQSENGEPLAFLARPVPAYVHALVKEISLGLSRGCYLFSLAEKDDEAFLVPVPDSLSPFFLLSLAKDVSIPELFLRETVFCEDLPEVEEELSGAFSLFSYRKIKKYIFHSVKKECAALHRKKAFLSLYTVKNERFSWKIYRIFRTFYRKMTLPKEKIKK